MDDLENDLKKLSSQVRQSIVVSPSSAGSLMRRARIRRLCRSIAAIGVTTVLVMGGLQLSRYPEDINRFDGTRTVSSIRLIRAAAKTENAGSARFRMFTTVDTDSGMGAPPLEMITGTGAFDFTTGRSKLTVNTSGGSPGSPMDIGASQVIRDKDAVYFKSPLVSSDKRWIRVAMPTRAYLGMESMMSLGLGGDPEQMLSYLHQINDTVEMIGKEQLRGIPTTHYRAVVEQHRMDAFEASTGFGREDPRLDVWIGNDGLLRKFTYSLSETSNPKSSIEIGLELYDIGNDIHIKLPPRSSVLDPKDLPATLLQETLEGNSKAAVNPAKL